MRLLFIDKNDAALAGIYAAAFALIIASAFVLAPVGQPAASGFDAVPQPWRCGDPESKYVSLAVNVDWGEEYLPDILDTLAAHNVKATFFLTGRWCENNPELAKDIALRGHEIGNHGYSHRSPNASTQQEVYDEIKRTEEAVFAATGTITRLYAPPSGECEEHVLRAAAEAGYETVLWSVDTIDWQQPDTATIIERVKSKIHGGAIILAHPTESTLQALADIITELSGEGYGFVTVSQNIGL